MANFGKLSTYGMENVRIKVVTSQGESIPLPTNQAGSSFTRGGAEVTSTTYTYGTQTVYGSSYDNSKSYGQITAQVTANITNARVIESIRNDRNLTVTFEQVGVNGQVSEHHIITTACLTKPTSEVFETGSDKMIDVVFEGKSE